jgi:hypothetical protein
MRTDKVGKTYKTLMQECRCSSRIYRTDKVFYTGKPALVAISTDDDFCNWKTNCD